MNQFSKYRIIFSILFIHIFFQANTSENNIIAYQPSPSEDRNFKTAFSHGCELYREKKILEAIKAYQETISLNPDCYQAYLNLGICFYDIKRWFAARDALEKAINLKPDYAKAHFYMAQIMKQLGRMDDALTHYAITLEHDKKFISANLERARIYKDRHKFNLALDEVETGLAQQQGNIKLLFEKANILNTINKIEQSLEIYLQLLNVMPTSKSLLYNIGYTLKKLGKNEEARPYYDTLLQLYPDHIEGHFGYGLLCLSEGDFKTGWKEYEWRWLRSGQQMKKRYQQFPEWDGSDLHNKTILLFAEQGLGDTFQFIRFAALAKEKGGYVIVAVQSPLVDIIKNCPFIDKVIKFDQNIEQHIDVQAPLMSIPYILGIDTIDAIPFYNEPYLFANKKLEKEWSEKLSSDKNFKIGICWQGNSNYSTSFLRAVVKQKSIPLKVLIQLADIPHVTLYNLQKITGTDQITPAYKNKMVSFEGDFDASNGRFMDTAAIIPNLDLVISIDTSMAHLSAGLCKTPVWNILPNPADWRWMNDQLDSPWYKIIRLFRQPTPGDWQGLIDQVTDALIPLIEEKTGKKIDLNQIKKSKSAVMLDHLDMYKNNTLQQQLEQEIINLKNKIEKKRELLMQLMQKKQQESMVIKNIKTLATLYELHEYTIKKHALLTV